MVEEVNGEDETQHAYAAVAKGLPSHEGQVDLYEANGDSTQFNFCQDVRMDERDNLPLGAVPYAARHVLVRTVPSEDLGEVLSVLADDFASLDGRPTPNALVAMGGVVTNLAAVKHAMEAYDPVVIRGTVLDREGIDREIERFRTLDADDR